MALKDMVERKFRGQWKYLDKALFEISVERAEKACMELALFLRIVDDEHEISPTKPRWGASRIVADSS